MNNEIVIQKAIEAEMTYKVQAELERIKDDMKQDPRPDIFISSANGATARIDMSRAEVRRRFVELIEYLIEITDHDTNEVLLSIKDEFSDWTILNDSENPFKSRGFGRRE